jgi:hypothetical protein
MSTPDHDEAGRPQRRRTALVVALSVLAAFVTRRLIIRRGRPAEGAEPHLLTSRRRGKKVTAKTIAQDLYDAGLQDEELFTAMWDWHDTTGIETRDMYTHYKALQQQSEQPAT